MRVLVVEDHVALAGRIAEGLRDAGMAVDVVHDGRAALDGARSAPYDVIVLDRDLPKLHGDTVCRSLAADHDAARILMLTAAGDLQDRVDGFELGADDYLGKPFAFAELLARIRARTRPPAQNGAPASTLSVGSVTLDLLSREAEIDGGRTELSAREFALLAYLMRHPGQVLSRQQILNGVWGYTFDPRSNLVDVYIGYLRRKLSANGSSPIETVRGMGYRMAREKPA